MTAARISVSIGMFFAVLVASNLQSAGQSPKEFRWVTVSDLNGPINKSSANLPPEPLVATDALNSGDTVVAGANASSRLNFFNGTTIVIHSNTQLTLEELIFDPFDRERYEFDLELRCGEITCAFVQMSRPASGRIRTPAGTIYVDSAARFRIVHHMKGTEAGFELELSVLEGLVSYEGLVDGATKSLLANPRTTLLISGKTNSVGQGVHFTREPAQRPLTAESRRQIEEIKTEPPPN